MVYNVLVRKRMNRYCSHYFSISAYCQYRLSASDKTIYKNDHRYIYERKTYKRARSETLLGGYRMKKNNTAPEPNKRNIKKLIDSISVGKNYPKWVFVMLTVLYLVTTIIVSLTAGSRETLFFAGSPIAVYTFAGVFSALSNICIFFLVVYFGKAGFYTALIALLAQFPMILYGIVVHKNISSLPGAFTNLFTAIAIVVIYINNVKIGKYQDRIRDQAVTDRLTGLPNRFACSELVEDLIKHNERFAIVSIDINNFKNINDTMGHDVGNLVLIHIVERWKKVEESNLSNTTDIITRQGGDEFALIIKDFGSKVDIEKTISCYEAALEEKITVENCDFFLTASFGYAEYPTDATASDMIFTYADAAMYEVKHARNSNHILHFSPELLKVEQSLEIERKVRNALDNDSFFFNLQPQYDIKHKLRGFEALARLKNTDGSLISPAEFIPVAEKAGLIDKVDLTIFRKSAMFFGQLLNNTGSDISLSINVSVRHLMKNDFIDEVKNILEQSKLPPSHLEIEITESVMIESAEKALQSINEIKSMGVKIAIDDFGTGYSSLSYLYKFPADLIKVDKSFIDTMNSSDSSKQYVAAIISIGHIMKFDVISEGVEQQDQLETLRSVGCDYIQGFIWGRPMPPEEAENLVRSLIPV